MLINHPGLIPEHGWIHGQKGEEEDRHTWHLVICMWCHQIHRPSPRLRFQHPPLGRRLRPNSRWTVGHLTCSLLLALICVKLRSSHFPSPGLMFPNYSESPGQHQGHCDCSRPRIKGTQGQWPRGGLCSEGFRDWACAQTEGTLHGWLKSALAPQWRVLAQCHLLSFDYEKSKGTASLNTLLFCFCCLSPLTTLMGVYTVMLYMYFSVQCDDL